MELEVNDALAQAISAHEKGLLQDADRFYSAILKVHPKHPDANHNMGVLAVQVGKLQHALPLFKQALQSRPEDKQFWVSYIDTLIEVDDISSAHIVFKKAEKLGLSGDIFNKLYEKLNHAHNKNQYEPSLSELYELHIDFTEKKYIEGVKQAHKLLKTYPHSSIVYFTLGSIQSELNEYENSITALKKAIDLKPNHAQAHFTLGNVYNNQGKKMETALDHFKKAIEIQPQFAEAHNNLGLILFDSGKYDDAINHYQMAIDINNRYFNAIRNLATLYQKLGSFSLANEKFEMALEVEPGNVLVLTNLGANAFNSGDLDSAQEYYKKAAVLNPDLPEVYYNLGNLFYKLENFNSSLENYQKALELDPAHIDTYNNMGVVLRNIKFNSYLPKIATSIDLLLLCDTSVRPSDISYAISSLIKLNPLILEVYSKLKKNILSKEIYEVCENLSKTPLLINILRLTTIPDKDIEYLLTELRKEILLNFDYNNVKITDESVHFCVSLALNCFISEYIFDETDLETEACNKLELTISRKLKTGLQPHPMEIAILACYKGLYEYEWYSLLKFPNNLTVLNTRQIIEIREEEKIKKHISSVGKISDSVSLNVQKQYEINPYPRWTKAIVSSSDKVFDNIVTDLDLDVVWSEVMSFNNPSILIAGCGTGQHSIETALAYPKSSIVAIDISSASLAYAIRKSREIGITNIQYFQADLLDILSFDQTFDIIECSGVLHHMNVPLDGWFALRDQLNDNGMMKVGLYSKIAREHITKHRGEYSKVSDNCEIKRIRKIIRESEAPRDIMISRSRDFYSLSAVRDLLFHTQEHQFTLPQIKAALDTLGFRFSGFLHYDIANFNRFRHINPNHSDLYDLDKWHSFELKNRDTFSAMYQFWCQKRSL